MTDKLADEIEKEVQSKFMDSVFSYLEDGRSGLHVTDTTQDCERHGYWTWKAREAEEEGENISERSALTFFIGKKLHELPMTEDHEEPLLRRTNYRGLDFGGTPDEWYIRRDGKTLVIVDKKTTTFPQKSAQPQYAKQAARYAAMWYIQKSASGEDESIQDMNFYGCILYINLADKDLKAFAFKIDIKSEINDLNRLLDVYKNADDTGEVPPSNIHWLCGYCPFVKACRQLDAGNESWFMSLSFTKKPTDLDTPPKIVHAGKSLPPIEDLGSGLKHE